MESLGSAPSVAVHKQLDSAGLGRIRLRQKELARRSGLACLDRDAPLARVRAPRRHVQAQRGDSLECDRELAGVAWRRAVHPRLLVRELGLLGDHRHVCACRRADRRVAAAVLARGGPELGLSAEVDVTRGRGVVQLQHYQFVGAIPHLRPGHEQRVLRSLCLPVPAVPYEIEYRMVCEYRGGCD
jgi:hypothetical protein